jgi:hypothetical protein
MMIWNKAYIEGAKKGRNGERSERKNERENEEHVL